MMLQLPPGEPAPALARPWTILVVDDDPEVHAVTQLGLRDFRFDGRSLRILEATSAQSAEGILENEPDIALVLLDVVMETEHAGLDLVRDIRERMRNFALRIVLRTGQPGQAPALKVAEHYQIDDYRTKTELTFERLQVLVTNALRSYRLVRQLEERSRSLAEHASELERFSYVASHDMQTPLCNIIRLVQLLERRLTDVLDDSQRELLGLVVASTRDLQKLVQDLLTLARLGRTRHVIEMVDLQALVERIGRQIQSLIDERSAQVEARALPSIAGNATLLEQLLRNLMENAIKFQPGGAPVVRVTAAPAGKGWEIRLQDEGIGIASEYLERIFEPFQRLNPTDQFPGSGVGLAICRRVVQLHGGTIRAESAPGKGTTMVIWLPSREVGTPLDTPSA
jgi:signal transduction histidine kinase